MQPYREGKPIVSHGKAILSADIERIVINTTDESSSSYKSDAVIRSLASGRSINWVIASMGRDVTDEFITGPPGPETGSGLDVSGHATTPTDARKVFVVHGRNLKARDALFVFLRAIGLGPVEWTEAVKATGRPTPYVGEILDAAFSAQAAVVLFTPDDEARLRESLRSAGDPPYESQLTGQARPNVLFEAGMAMGRDQGRTILVELGSLRPFSDIAGRHTIRLDNTSPRRQELAQRLQAAGCPVNLEGVDWHTVGDFDAALEQSR